jgi:flagellar assembly factor FliW
MSNGIEITVSTVSKRGVRLAMKVPKRILVLRGEVYDAIAAANTAAADISFDPPSTDDWHTPGKVNMQLANTRFGSIEFKDEKIITLSAGLVGFPEEKRFVLLEPTAGNDMAWLQSLSTPGLAFPVIDSASIVPNPMYDTKQIAKEAGIASSDVSVLVIVAVSTRGPKLIANLLAPIVLDAKTRKGRQVVLDGERYSASTLLAAKAS